MRRIFIHGFMGKADSSPLRGHWRTPVLPGHADEPSRSFSDEAERIARIIDDETIICGYSMGGRLALAASSIEQPKRLILIGAHPGLVSEEPREHRRARVGDWHRVLREQGLPAFVDMWESLPLFATQRALPEEVLAQQRTTRLSHSAEGIAAAAEQLGLHNQPNLWPSLKKLSSRTHYIVGEHDPKYVAIAQRAQALGVSITIAAGAGHNVLLEKPEVVNAQVELAA